MSSADVSDRPDDPEHLAEGSPRGADGLATDAAPDGPSAPDPGTLAEGSPRGDDGLATDG